MKPSEKVSWILIVSWVVTFIFMILPSVDYELVLMLFLATLIVSITGNLKLIEEVVDE